MTLAKTAALSAGLAGAFGLGVWTGPMMTADAAGNQRVPVAVIEASAAPVLPPAPPAPPKRRADRTASRETAFAPMRTGVAADTPELQSRLKPFLKPGVNMEIASAGFRSAEHFATVVHASQNVNVPFMLLKHRMLDEGDTLVAAIRKSKPSVDAVVEADRARAEARSDLASLSRVAPLD